MVFDYIKETKQIIAMLRSEGANAFADKVQESLDSAFTSTELLMGVRFHLSKLPNSISSSALVRIQVLIKEIDRILNR